MVLTELNFFIDKPKSPEVDTNPGKIAVTVITYYPKWYPGELRNVSDTDKVRGDLFFQLADRVSQSRYDLVVANAKESSPTFKRALSELENTRVVERPVPDRVTGSLMAIEAAAETGAEIFVYSQPEKVNIVSFINQLVVPFSDPEMMIVAGHRTPRSIQSYPDYMRDSEELGNLMINQMLRRAGIMGKQRDMEWFFGVSAFRICPQILDIMRTVYKFHQSLNMNEAEKLAASYPYVGVGTSVIPRIAALAAGLKTEEVDIDFQYSPEQKTHEEDPSVIEDFKNKRRKQRLSMWARVWNFIAYLKGGESLLKPMTIDTQFIQSIYS